MDSWRGELEWNLGVELLEWNLGVECWSGLLAWSCWSYVLEGNLGVLIWSGVLKNYIYITELSIRLESGVEWSLRVKFRLLIGSDAIEKIYT